jgi:hypothetical protein
MLVGAGTLSFTAAVFAPGGVMGTEYPDRRLQLGSIAVDAGRQRHIFQMNQTPMRDQQSDD